MTFELSTVCIVEFTDIVKLAVQVVERDLAIFIHIEFQFDFGYGMGPLMYTETYDYTTRGVMNNVADGMIIHYENTPDTWAEIRSQWSSVVDTVVDEYNAKLGG